MLDYNEFYLYLIRHGQSETNAQPDHVGQLGTSKLTDKGRHQAKLLGDRLVKENIKLDMVYSSDYIRALDTATIAVNDKCPIIIDHALREYDAGDWTGGSRKEIYDTQTLLRMAAMTNGFRPPNGESIHMVERRASKWLEDNILYNALIQKSADRKRLMNLPAKNIFVFSHGIVIKSLLHYIMGFDQSFTWRIVIDNTSITKLYFNQEGWKLICINDCSHLI